MQILESIVSYKLNLNYGGKILTQSVTKITCAGNGLNQIKRQLVQQPNESDISKLAIDKQNR